MEARLNDSFEWDSAKNELNKKKHGISFEEATKIFDGPILTRLDDRFHSGEVREIRFGFLGSVLILCVAHTDRNDKTRIISARKATKSERKLFHAYFEKTLR